ncbi:hypothetical protein KKI23_01160, partial [Patescibacteria group bacterium]|nr:hypothetical protein [Patescibacteria group bacterium]
MLLFIAQFLPLFYLGTSAFFSGLKRLADKFSSYRQLIIWLSLTTAIFIFFAKFYSPQWWLWLLPPLILQIDSKKEIILIIVLDLLNYWQFPVLYDSVFIWDTSFDLVVLIRSVLFVWLIYSLIKKLKNPDAKLAPVD